MLKGREIVYVKIGEKVFNLFCEARPVCTLVVSVCFFVGGAYGLIKLRCN